MEFSPLLALSRLRLTADLRAHLKGFHFDEVPLEMCFDQELCVQCEMVPPQGQRVVLSVWDHAALGLVVLKSDSCKLIVRWGERAGEYVEVECGTGRMASIADLLEDAARGLDSVASMNAVAGAASAALRNLPLPARITFQDPLAHTRITDDNADVPVSSFDLSIEHYARTWEELSDLGLTRHLVRNPAPITSPDAACDALLPLLLGARRIVAFTGAGVSVESNIPSYRGCADALWENFSEEDASLPNFRRDPAARSRYWQVKTYFYSIVLKAQPNYAHLFLGRLAAAGCLHAVITQNIDQLHERGGVPRERMINLHGEEGRVQCDSCGALGDRAAAHAALANATPPLVSPLCSACGGFLRPTTIMFGESLKVDTLTAANRVVEEADLLLVMGTSLVVMPANTLPTVCLSKGVPVIIVNPNGTTHLDCYATLLLRAAAGELCERLDKRMPT